MHHSRKQKINSGGRRNLFVKLMALWICHSLTASHALASPTGSAFLELSPSARAYALGRSHSVSALGAQAMGANPANLSQLRGRIELFSSFFRLLDGAQYGHAAIAFSRPQAGQLGIGSIGLSMTNLSIGGFEGRDRSGQKTGSSFETRDTALGISLASRGSTPFRYGVTAKVFRSEIAGFQSDISVASDFGVSYVAGQARWPMIVGASMNNVGQGTKFINQRDSLPTTFNVGLAMDIGIVSGVFQVSRLLLENQTNMSLGLEYELGSIFLRAGYRTESRSQNLALQSQEGAAGFLRGFSTGLGFGIGPATLDYALGQDILEFGLSHRIALTVHWGKI